MGTTEMKHWCEKGSKKFLVAIGEKEISIWDFEKNIILKVAKCSNLNDIKNY